MIHVLKQMTTTSSTFRMRRTRTAIAAWAARASPAQVGVARADG
jgi:hypothetical protein